MAKGILDRYQGTTFIAGEQKHIGEPVARVKVDTWRLIHDETPRTQWKLGVIIQLHRGKDGLVRSVTLRTIKGNLISRPIETMLSKRFRNSRFATTSKVWNPLKISMTLSRMSNKNNHMVKEKSSNWVKINYAWKCAEIDFSYKQDANIVNFQGKFATSSESARTKWEWYTIQLNFLL